MARSFRRPWCVLFAAVLFAAPLRAQVVPAAGEPVDDLILRVIADLSDLRYGDAIRRGREVMSYARPMMSVEQASLLHTAIAAAFYPEEAAAQRPDSALAELEAAIRVKPDVVLPVELAWDGLDSLLTVARSRSFAVVVRADSTRTLVGPAARAGLMVQSSRPARFTLRTGVLGSSTSVVQSTSAELSLASVLMFRALEGNDVLLAPGEYTATVTAVDAAGDSVRVQRRLLVEGEPLYVIAPPTFDESRLLPERRRGNLTVRVIASALLGGLVFAATSVRVDNDFEAEFKPSGSSTSLGLGVFAVGVGTHWLSRGRRDPDAVAANARMREDHRRAVEAAAAESEQRRNNYRVRVTVSP
jgi:hypothetical protein